MISIITSIYKAERYLPAFVKHLESFAAWTQAKKCDYQHIILANDPSAEERKIFKRFETEPWLNFIAIPREPLYATWNRGVAMAQGEIIGFWNVDDVRYPLSLLEGQNLINAGADLVYFPFKINRYLKIFEWYILVHKQTINHQMREFNEQTKPAFLYEMNCGPFFMFTKALYQRVGPFDEQFKIAGDFDWCMRAVKASAKLVKAKGLGGEFRVDGGGLSAGGSMRHKVENNLVFKRSGSLDKLLPVDESVDVQYSPGSIYYQDKIIKYLA